VLGLDGNPIPREKGGEEEKGNITTIWGTSTQGFRRSHTRGGYCYVDVCME